MGVTGLGTLATTNHLLERGYPCSQVPLPSSLTAGEWSLGTRLPLFPGSTPQLSHSGGVEPGNETTLVPRFHSPALSQWESGAWERDYPCSQVPLPSKQAGNETTHVMHREQVVSLEPRPSSPRFYLAALEKNRGVTDFLQGCEIKSGQGRTEFEASR